MVVANGVQGEGVKRKWMNGLSRMLMIRFDIEHLTGKEAAECEQARLKVKPRILRELILFITIL